MLPINGCSISLVPVMTWCSSPAGDFFPRSILQTCFQMLLLPFNDHWLHPCTYCGENGVPWHLWTNGVTILWAFWLLPKIYLWTTGYSKCTCLTCRKSSLIILCVWSLSTVPTSLLYRLLETLVTFKNYLCVSLKVISFRRWQDDSWLYYQKSKHCMDRE